jgi:hypothetical protein
VLAVIWVRLFSFLGGCFRLWSVGVDVVVAWTLVVGIMFVCGCGVVGVVVVVVEENK